jgi:hypothetical protein
VWDICPTRSEAALVSQPNASESIRHRCPNDPARLSTFRLLYANVRLPVEACCLVQAGSSLSWRTAAAAFRLSAHSQSISTQPFPLPAPFVALNLIQVNAGPALIRINLTELGCSAKLSLTRLKPRLAPPLSHTSSRGLFHPGPCLLLCCNNPTKFVFGQRQREAL